MTAREARAALAEIIRVAAAEGAGTPRANASRFYPIAPGQVVDALAAGEAERIAWHLIADATAQEWYEAPGHLREVVRHIRKMEENPNG